METKEIKIKEKHTSAIDALNDLSIVLKHLEDVFATFKGLENDVIKTENPDEVPLSEFGM